MRARHAISCMLALWAFLALASCASTAPGDEAGLSRTVAVDMAMRSTVSLVIDDEGRGDAFGSAIVLNEQGYLVTAHHVIDGAMGITVLLPGGRATAARVIADDPVGDLAVLQCNFVSGVMQAAVAAGSLPGVGEDVLSVGNPFGTSRLGGSPSVSAGVISATQRSFASEKTGRVYLNCLQHDAATNPGNSGGGLFNMRGELLGMNVLINTPLDAPSESGVAFALPVQDLFAQARRMMGGQKTSHGWLGARGYRSVLWMGSDGLGRLGFMLREIEDGTPAFQAGLQAGDVIVRASWGGGSASWPKAIGIYADWLVAEDALPVGQPVSLTISRAGREMEFGLTVAERSLRR